MDDKSLSSTDHSEIFRTNEILNDLVWKEGSPSLPMRMPLDRGPINPVRQTPGAPTMQEALKLAILHIEHMSRWIASQRGGYSFESLGEDMPGIYAALKEG